MDNVEKIDMIIDCENENEKTDVEIRAVERKDAENSVIVIMPAHYSRIIEEYYMKFEKPPTIYLGNKLVKDYEKLPYENCYEDDEEWGKICLFPKAKYEFMF